MEKYSVCQKIRWNWKARETYALHNVVVSVQFISTRTLFSAVCKAFSFILFELAVILIFNLYEKFCAWTNTKHIIHLIKPNLFALQLTAYDLYLRYSIIEIILIKMNDIFSVILSTMTTKSANCSADILWISESFNSFCWDKWYGSNVAKKTHFNIRLLQRVVQIEQF